MEKPLPPLALPRSGLGSIAVRLSSQPGFPSSPGHIRFGVRLVTRLAAVKRWAGIRRLGLRAWRTGEKAQHCGDAAADGCRSQHPVHGQIRRERQLKIAIPVNIDARNGRQVPFNRPLSTKQHSLSRMEMAETDNGAKFGKNEADSIENAFFLLCYTRARTSVLAKESAW